MVIWHIAFPIFLKVLLFFSFQICFYFPIDHIYSDIFPLIYCEHFSRLKHFLHILNFKGFCDFMALRPYNVWQLKNPIVGHLNYFQLVGILNSSSKYVVLKHFRYRITYWTQSSAGPFHEGHFFYFSPELLGVYWKG